VIDFVPVFIFFFAVIDPIGTVPVFIAVTKHLDEQAKRQVAVRATLTSGAILIFFVVAGEIILTAMGIPLAAFQVAGGIVLFLFALTMIFGDSKPEQEMKMIRSGSELAVFPLSVPSIASPGAMLAAVLLTENASYGIVQQALTVLMMLGVLSVALVFMLAAAPIHRLVGDAGANVISKVMGLILASVATASTLEGIEVYFGI
jgi:multiple antibiotic resistance protein